MYFKFHVNESTLGDKLWLESETNLKKRPGKKWQYSERKYGLKTARFQTMLSGLLGNFA